MVDLSIIIPVHNEQNRLPDAMRSLGDYVMVSGRSVEVILVENGSTDLTWDYCRFYQGMFPWVRTIQVGGRGKGAAVRAGMLAAKGEWRYMADVDLSAPIHQITQFWLAGQIGEVLVGSREVQGAQRVGEPLFRHWMGRVFNSMVRVLSGLDLADTQCGFKMFSAKAAVDLFSKQTITGMAFDVEILFLADQLGYEIVEVPLEWHYNGDSRVRLVQDSLAMAQEILRVKRRWSNGQYQQSWQPIR